jgi:hypothetical protein
MGLYRMCEVTNVDDMSYDSFGFLSRLLGVLLMAGAVLFSSAGRSAARAAEAQKNAAIQPEDVHRLHDGMTVLLNNDQGSAFELVLKVRDINYSPRGPAELLAKVYDPQGRVVVREVVPDDGIVKGLFDGPAAGFDHLALYFADTRAKGLTPAVRYGGFLDPARVGAMAVRTFKYQVPAGAKGVYRLILVGQPDLLVSYETRPDLKAGVAGSPDLLYATGKQFETGYFWVPPGTTGLDLSFIQIDGVAGGGRFLNVLDAQEKTIASVGGEDAFAAMKVKFGTVEQPSRDGQVLKVRLSGGPNDALFGLYLLTPKGNRYGKPGGRLAALICADAQTAQALKNGAMEHDGAIFYQHYAVKLHDYLKTLKPADFVSPDHTPLNPGTYVPLGSHEKPARTCADMQMFDYLHNKDRATLNRALKDMLEGMSQIGFDDQVMRGPNLAYEMGAYSYFYPRPAMWMIEKSDLPDDLKQALRDFCLQVGDRLAFCRGLELVNGNATASLIAQLKYCSAASGDKMLGGLFDTYFTRFTTGGFGERVGVGASGPIQEGFGYDQHYGTYVLRGWKAVMEDFKGRDNRFVPVYDNIVKFYSYVYNDEVPGGAWSSRTAARIPSRTYEPSGPVPFKGYPGPSFTDNVNGAGEVFAARRPGYYVQTYHGRITPAYLTEVGLGQIGFGGGMIGQLHIPGRGPVLVSRLHGDYGKDMDATLWREFAIHSVVGTTMDGLPMIGGNSEPKEAKLEGTVLTSSADVRGGSVRVMRTYDFQEDGIKCVVALAPARVDKMFGLWSKKSPLRGVVNEAYEILPLLGTKPGQIKVAQKASPDRKAVGVAKLATVPLVAIGQDGKEIGALTEGEDVTAKAVVLDRGGYGVRVELDMPRAVRRGFEGSLLIKLAEPGTPAQDVKMEYRLVPFGAKGASEVGSNPAAAGEAPGSPAGGAKANSDQEKEVVE